MDSNTKIVGSSAVLCVDVRQNTSELYCPV